MIDSHHHIWYQTDLPWLIPEQPRIFGEYSSIRRDYLIEEYLQDISDSGITQSVYVQANWSPDQYQQEVAWVQSIANEYGWPHAIVGYADFTKGDVRYQLDQLKAYPLMRGIRQQFHWHKNPQYRFADRADLVLNQTVQRNISRLAEYGWCFDLQVFTDQFDYATDLIENCADVTFILEHSGMPEDQSLEGRSSWENGLYRLSECSNLVTKLSGFGTFIRCNDRNFVSETVKTAVEIFGAERCMFGSNFPIEKIWTDYRTLIETYQSACRIFSAEEQHDIFYQTAATVYKI